MSRGLSTAIKNVLASNKFNIATLVKFVFNTTYYYNNSYQTLTYDSNNYISGGILINLDEIKEESSINTAQIGINLTNATTTILNDLLTYGHIDKSITVYFAFLNDDSTIIDAPFEIFSGTINQMQILESAESSVLKLGIANHWALLKQLNGRNLTDESQSRFFPGDTIFKFKAQSDKQIIWGVDGEVGANYTTGGRDVGGMDRSRW
jgi:hypothetical protein